MKFEEYLEQILPNIDDSNIISLVKKAIDNSFTNLTSNEQSNLKKGISDYIMEECPICGEKIPYEDMEIAIYNGQCSLCQYDWDKNYSD